MQPETKQTVDSLRDKLSTRRANAESAFKTFKMGELLKDLPQVELTFNSLPNIPTLLKPRIR